MKICKIDGCEKKVFSKGFCKLHYSRNYRGVSDMGPALLITRNKGLKCAIDGCEKNAWAKGLCQMHYWRKSKGIADMRPGNLPAKDPFGWSKRPRRGVCGAPGCDKPHYSKGYCHNHYEMIRRNGRIEKLKNIVRFCSVPGCKNRTTPHTNLCDFHRLRKCRGKDLERPKGNSGHLNHMWKGGVADYPNHYEMKKNRKIVLIEANYKCHFCGKKATQVHHKDLSKTNHSRENLLPVCPKCNGIHRRPSTSKFKRLYGYKVTDIAAILGCSGAEVSRLHKENRLRLHLPLPEEIRAILF